MKLVIIGRSCLISGVILTHNLYNLKIELVVMMKKRKQKINEKGEGSTNSEKRRTYNVSCINI